MNGKYIMLTLAADNEGVERPILVNTAHIISIENVGIDREMRLAPDRLIHITQQWDELQDRLDAPY